MALLTEPEKGPDVSQVCAKCWALWVFTYELLFFGPLGIDVSPEELLHKELFNAHWQVLLWLPTGGRKQRRFESSAKVEAIYDYIDSLGTIGPGRYSLVSNFPRIVYGPDKMNLTLRTVGLHPTASLFVEMN
jgi:hypothetical protein